MNVDGVDDDEEVEGMMTLEVRAASASFDISPESIDTNIDIVVKNERNE